MSYTMERENMLREMWVAHSVAPFDYWTADSIYGLALNRILDLAGLENGKIPDCSCIADDFADDFPDAAWVTEAITSTEAVISSAETMAVELETLLANAKEALTSLRTSLP